MNLALWLCDWYAWVCQKMCCCA